MYQVGDKVRIREDLTDRSGEYRPVGINPIMVELAGSVAVITECHYYTIESECLVYKLDIDDGRWDWIDKMLTPVVRRSSKELYEVWGDMEC